MTNSIKHIALIPDGFRRWARMNGTSNYDSYESGFVKMGTFIEYFAKHEIRNVTLFCSSTHNFKRSDNDIRDFQASEMNFLEHIVIPIAQARDIKVQILGDYEIMPYANQSIIDKCQTSTRGGKHCTLTLCMNYSSTKALGECRYSTPASNIPPVDILIRTGNANVLSDFLLPQLAFARIYFSPLLFNDFTLEDLDSIKQQYENLSLHFGE